jgi:chromosome segregation ATPase
MEETKPRPGFPGDRAQVAAEKLRALRERANGALDEHRQRLSQIESELSLRVRQLADEFETASAGGPTPSGHDQEVAALREQLQSDRAKHDKFVEQLALARRQLDAIQAQPCAACQDAAHQLADAQGEISRLREQVQSADRQQEDDRARHEKFAEQVAAARQAISDLQSKSHEQTAQLQAELDAARAAKTAAEEQVAGLARDLELLHTECDALQTRADRLEKERSASLDQQRQAADAEAKAHRDQIATLKEELAKAQAIQAAAEKERDATASQAKETERQKADREAELARLTARAAEEQKAHADRLAAAEAKQAELQRQLTDIEAAKAALAASHATAEANGRKLEESLCAAQLQASGLEKSNGELAELQASLASAKTEVANATHARNELQTSLDQAQAELAKLRDNTCPRAELADLQQKFDLALADVQKLKRENGQLREDLASRPQSTDQESPELVAYRTECEALTQRVKELEKAATSAANAAPSQELDDLHRRFEMAVDDVRQLKQENTQLRDQLAKSKSAGPAGPAAQGGSNDWATQRARLMAMLEQEDGEGPIDAARRKERATIEETIERTDRAIADKDRELAELRAEVVHTEGASCNLDREREQILSTDELVAAERERLAKLQTEWEDKMRAAELEFSVERAKLAREQAAVRERLFELQKLESIGAGAAAEAGDSKPRRRWLAALGLGEEGDDGPKPK